MIQLNNELVLNPYHVNIKRYSINGQYFSHKLNGITIWIHPDSPEGKLIQHLYKTQYSRNKMTEVDWYHERNPSKLEISLRRIQKEEEKRIEKEFKEWDKTKGFEWDR